MKAFKACPRRHYFAYELGIRRDRESAPLRIGSAIHGALDLRAQGSSFDEALIWLQQQYADVPSWTEGDEWAVEFQTAARLVHGYYHRYADETMAIAETEQSFDLPLVNPTTRMPSRTFRLAGKIDKIARLQDTRAAIVEHKTTGDSLDSSSDYWSRLRLDQQISLYVIAARATGHDVATVIYDVIRKPGIAPKIVDRKSGRRETPEEFGDRLTTDIGERPDFYFARREIPRLEADLDEFRVELWQQARSIHECQKSGVWPRNTDSCLQPFPCEYRQICFDGLRADADTIPLGFKRVNSVHPELELPCSSNSQTERLQSLPKR